MDEHEHAPHSHRDEHGAVAASLRAAILITLLIFAVEVVGGYVSGSLSLLSDAVHMLGDLFALLLSLAAVLLARQLPTSARTYGYHRAEVLAAFVNGLVLLAVTAGILLSAYDRLRSPPEIEAPIMLGVAVIGLVANLVVIARLHGHGGLGVRSALLHVASDALSSAAVVGAAAVILVTGWTVVDPVLSVLIALLVLASAVRLLRETTAILLQFTPPGLDLEAVIAAMEEVDGVDSVHDVHVWALSLGPVHPRRPRGHDRDGDAGGRGDQDHAQEPAPPHGDRPRHPGVRVDPVRGVRDPGPRPRRGGRRAASVEVTRAPDDLVGRHEGRLDDPRPDVVRPLRPSRSSRPSR